MKYKMQEYQGVDLSVVEIPEEKQDQLSRLFGGSDFSAQEFFNDLSEATKGFTIEDEEALEFDELLYKVVKAYEKKEDVKLAEEEVVVEPTLAPSTEIVPSQDELLQKVRDELEVLNDIIADKEMFDMMSDEQKILIQDQLETLTDILNG
jgi:tRNA A22 N-methylase